MNGYTGATDRGLTTGAEGTGATSSSGSATQSIMNPYEVASLWRRVS